MLPGDLADGRWIAYDSLAANVVAGDTNAVRDVFLFDAVSRTTQRVSVATGDIQSNGSSGGAAISADGRWVAYYSSASNLVAGDTNDGWDVFLFDRVGRTTQRVSVGTGEASQTRVVGPSPQRSRLMAAGSPTPPMRRTSWPATRTTHGTSSSSTRSAGPQSGCRWGRAASRRTARPRRDISADGRWITYRSAASNLVDGDTNGVEDTYLFDTVTRATLRVSVGVGESRPTPRPSLGVVSADGRWITYTSGASNLVAGDTNGAWDVFLYDAVGRTTSRVSVAAGDVQGNGASRGRALSSDGRWITYDSDASNLVAGDTNGVADVFLFDTVSRTTQRVSVANDGLESTGGGSVNSAISGMGVGSRSPPMRRTSWPGTPTGRGTCS